MTPKASIIIVSYNGIEHLERCLTSVVEDAGVLSEIVVVDNASADGSADFVASHFPTVKLVRNKANSGFAAACNQGALLANGPVLVFLNQDTQVRPGWLAGLLEPLENDTAALSTSKVLLMSQPDKINCCGQEIHFAGLAFARGVLCDLDRFVKTESVGAICGASFCVRRDVWQELGGFDPDFFMYFEDTDLSWRAQLAGYRCVDAPASTVYHADPFNPGKLTLYYFERNRYLLLLRNWRWATLLFLSPGLALADLLDWGHMLLMGRKGLMAKLHALVWIATNLSDLTKSRRRIQATRKVPDWRILEIRTYSVTPKVRTGGPVGSLLVRLCNPLFFAIHWQARRLCRVFGL